MKSKITGVFILLILSSFLAEAVQAQVLNKIKRKVENATGKNSDKPADNKEEKGATETKEPNDVVTSTNSTDKTVTPTDVSNTLGDSDFIPGSTVLYFDNFENDRIGENPAGWLTTRSAEVVNVGGLKGKWLKLASVSSNHITRNKKQSWSNSYTVEFDILIVKKEYDPRIEFTLINTGGSLVTDEMNLRNGKHIAYVSTILGNEGKTSRVSLYGNNNINKPLQDRMSEQLAYSNTVPVHISMCVQGKRFRFWWDDKKVFDMEMINEQYMPNQLGFNFGSVGGCEYYITNIRVAKDIPATRPTSPLPDKSTVPVADTDPANTGNKTNESTDGPAAVNLQSKILTISLPYAQIMKTGEFTFTFVASKEEGNSKENYFKIKLESGNTTLKPETFNFKEINQKKPLYGTKKYPEINSTEAVLYYGNAKKPYIYKFSPIIANATMASFVSASLERTLPSPSSNTKLVIEKVEDGKASGYFIFGIMIQGLKPVTKGDAMTETFTDGFSGEIKCTFSKVPVY